MLINWQVRELNLKIVYYGPALSGKTTNIEQIHAKVDPKRRGELVSLKTAEDRTLYFDFLQLELGKIGGLTPKIHLYTVPGQSYYEASRRIVLKGADGIVFVADADPRRLAENLTAWRDMKKHLQSLNIPFNKIPIVVQINKQDLPKTIPIAYLQKLFQLNGSPTFGATAIQGKGVFDTLKSIISKVIKQVQKEMA